MIGFKPLGAGPIGAILATTLTMSAASSSAALGSPQLSYNISAEGVASTSSVGRPTALVRIHPSGIASSATVGQPAVRYNIELPGVGSTSSIGSPAASLVITVGTVSSSSSLGSPSTAYNMSISGTSSQATAGSPTVVPGAVELTPTSSTTTVTFGDLTTRYNATITGVASGATVGSPTVIPGAVTITAPSSITTTLTTGSPSLVYVITGRSVSRSTLIGSPIFTNDATLTFDDALQDIREFAALSETIDPSRVSPFINGAGELVYYGAVLCHGVSETAANRTSYVKPDATNLYDPAGIVAGQTYEGRSVPDGEWGYRYVGGIVQARVLGDASTVAGTVLKPTAGQYYLVRDPSPSTQNAFVLKEDHTSTTEELKLVHVKIGL